jgi:hypothetical protein
MNTAVRRGAIVAFLVCSVACESSGPTLPSRIGQPAPLASPPPPPTPPPSPTPTPIPTPPFPPLSGPSRTFIFASQLAFRVSNHTQNSRFVLYDNGAFVLEYVSLGGPGYRGGYKDENGVLIFGWEGWSSAGSWGATGTLQGEYLAVQYNLIMQHTDFEDAIYVLMR